MPGIPNKFIFGARKHAYSNTSVQFAQSGGNTPAKYESFTPRTTDVNNSPWDQKSTHFTPNWFKMSIRTVDRNNLQESDV